MPVIAASFWEFRMPNAATWFYVALVVAVALYFKFTRILSLRNWDVLALFLLVPGLLLREDANTEQKPDSPERGTKSAEAKPPGEELPSGRPLLWYAYLWLMCGSAFFLTRCLVDLALVRRPAQSPNLNFAGFAWLAAALFVGLIAVAVRRSGEQPQPVGRDSLAYEEAQRRVGQLVDSQAGDSVTRPWVRLTLAILSHLAIVAALIFIGWKHFQHAHIGMAAATLYLLLPYTGQFVEQVHHVGPMALIIWAVALYRFPTFAGLLLGLAAGSMYFPALIFPAWWSFYRGRGTRRFSVAFLLAGSLGLGLSCLKLWSDGQLGVGLTSVLDLSDWQLWKAPTTEGFWTGIHGVYRLPVFIAYLAFVATTAFWPSPKNLAHLIALSAAVLIGVQFWYADQGGVYVLWYLPLMILVVMRPNLTDRQPQAIVAETDWLNRLGRWIRQHLKRFEKVPEPAVPFQEGL